MLFALMCALFLFGCGAGNERPYNHDRDLNDVDIDETIIYYGNYVYRELNDYSVALEGYIGEEESISIPSTYGPYDVIEIRHLTNDFVKEINYHHD